MSPRARLAGMLVAAALAALAALVVGGGRPAGGGNGAAGAAAARAQAPGGTAATERRRERADALTRPRTIAGLPEVGRLSWRCDGDGRYTTRLTVDAASVFVSVLADRRRVHFRRQVDPGDAIETPLARVRSQTWRILFHHPVPHPMRMTVRVRFASAAAADGDCAVVRSTTRVRRASASPPRWLLER